MDGDSSYYMQYSATSGINLGYNMYFNNEAILSQFERILQLLLFKTEYRKYDFELIVDNARIHSAIELNLYGFGKNISTRCLVNSIEFVDDDGQTKRLSCLFTSGEHKEKSKDLLILGKELDFNVNDKIKLEDLHRILFSHPTFKSSSRLEKLSTKYQMKISFNLKYHGELNFIEGLRCSMKRFIRQQTDQTFPTMLRLIPESREYFLQKNL